MILDNTVTPKINAGLFLFYLALLGNYTGNLIPPDLAKFINKHRIMQLLISFFILLFTINLYTPNLKFLDILKYSAILWFWYLITSKQHLVASILTILLLITSFIMFNLSKNLEEDKTKSKAEKDKLIKLYNRLQNICFIVIIMVALIGGSLYFVEHYKQYGKTDKNFFDFLIKYLFMGKGGKTSL